MRCFSGKHQALLCLIVVGWMQGSASAFSTTHHQLHQPSSAMRSRAGSGITALLPSSSQGAIARSSPLFTSHSNNNNHHISQKRRLHISTALLFRRGRAVAAQPFLLMISLLRQCFQQRLRWSQLRRRVVVAYAAAILSLGVMTMGTALPANAASTATTAAAPVLVERVLQKTSPSLDQIIDQYVRDHMFQDDTYDPVESLYRETYDDATTGSYPQALKQVTGLSVTGSQEADATSGATRNPLLKVNIGSLLTNALQALQTKAGLSESAAIMVLAGAFVVAGPSVFLFSGMIIGGMSKRNMNRVMKDRYGDTYTVDATIKQEETVEAPDDEEDDDDEDEDDEDDQDEDDDDD